MAGVLGTQMLYRGIGFAGLQNSIERWFRTLKELTRRFYNDFQSRYRLLRIDLLLRLFTPME